MTYIPAPQLRWLAGDQAICHSVTKERGTMKWNKKADWYIDTQSQAGLYHWYTMQDGRGRRPRSLCGMFFYGPWCRQRAKDLQQDELCPECRARLSGSLMPESP